MASDVQDEFSKLLNSICTLSAEESRAAIDKLLPLGLTDLKNLKRSERSVALKLLQVIMNSCTNLYDEQGDLIDFLSPSLSSLSCLLNENIDGLSNEENFNGNENLGVELVQENIEILDCLLNLFSQLISNGRINVDHINCVPGSVVEVLLVIFKDCRAKNETSGLSSSMVEQYVIVYRKCTELYTLYIKFVTENLIIDSSYEDKIEFLISVLERMLDVGEVIAVMDLKTVSQHWKGYVKLSKLYSTRVKDRLNISKPIGQLVNNIMDIMNHISSMVQKKNNMDMTTCIQNLKIASFFLKIIIVLCEYYVDYLGDCDAIVRLIFGIYKCTYDCEKRRKDDNIDIIDNVRLHLTVAVAPLITQLTSDRSFIQGYVGALQKDFCNNLGDNEKVAIVVSLMTLLQALEYIPTDTQLLWIRSEPSLLQTVFCLILSCEKELLKPSICTPDISTELKNEMTLYDALLIRFSRFIISVKTPEFFEQFEVIMLRHVLQPQPLVALFASDLWCIIARFGSARLCLAHYNYLSNLLISSPKECALCIEKIYLLSLIDRLFSLLTEKQKSSVNNSQLSLHLEHLPGVTVDQIIRDKNMLPKIQQINSSLRKQEEENKLRIYDMLMESLNMKGFIESSEYLSLLIEVLQRVDQCIILQRYYESNQAFNHLFARLFLDTVSAFSKLLHLMSSDQFYVVISVFIKTVSCAGKLGAIKFLDSLSKTLDMIDIRKLIALVANLFKLLLLDENPIIHSKSIEVFCVFAYNANYTDIIPLTYCGNKLNSIVGNYINRKPRDILIQVTFDKYFDFLYNSQLAHKCARNVEQCKRKVEHGNELVKKAKLNESDISVLNTNFSDTMNRIVRCYEQCEYEKKEEIVKTITNLLDQLRKTVHIK